MLAKSLQSPLLLRAPHQLRTEILRSRPPLGFRSFSAAVLEGAVTTGRTHLYHRPRPLIHVQLHPRRQSTTVPSAPAPPPAPLLEQTPPTSTQLLQPPSSRLRRNLNTTALIFVLFTLGVAMSAAPALDTLKHYTSPPTDAETLTLYTPSTSTAQEINSHILNHPLALHLRAQGAEKWTESRPHLKIPASMAPHNLTGGTLLGPGRIEVPPLTFTSTDKELPSLIQISYLGPALCGHPGIIHGGLLATLLDEGLARCCFPALPNKVGVTASLKIDYRVPCPAERYVVLKAQTVKIEGRKAWVKGWIELLGDAEVVQKEGERVKLVEAEALFIEPKGARGMARVYSSQ